MLNYIWLSLILIGILVALGLDVNDIAKDTYRNRESVRLVIEFTDNVRIPFMPHREYPCRVLVDRRLLSEFYGIQTKEDQGETIEQLPATVTLSAENEGRLLIDVIGSSFTHWKKMAELQGGKKNILQGRVVFTRIEDDKLEVAFFVDPIRFVTISRVTNEGILRYARIAVELAIGLIGIMALWLGIMRIAEQSGLITKLASVLKPLTTRLFPDVPADHPAMGAMIMNISANMLGLANAATPLGLKAMEELNKLNRKLGTATDAMCTFLVINTSNVQLIPATVIAIRAATGSSNPTEILGAVMVATAVSTIVGVTVVKLLARLKYYREQLKV